MRKRHQILLVALSLVLWTVPAFADFTPIYFPDATYRAQTNYIDFSAVPDSRFKNGLNIAPFYSVSLNSVSDGYLEVGFGSLMYKATTPTNNWANWGVSPNSQRQSTGDPLPVLLSDDPYNNPDLTNYRQSISMTLTSPSPVYTFGFEAEPDMFNALYTMTAYFYNGGTLLGTIERPVLDWSPYDPSQGARLFAASSTDPITSVELSIQGTPKTPFAVAAFRYSVPEPATMLLLGFGLIGLAGFRRKFGL